MTLRFSTLSCNYMFDSGCTGKRHVCMEDSGLGNALLVVPLILHYQATIPLPVHNVRKESLVRTMHACVDRA